jgi:hypothetical protein
MFFDNSQQLPNLIWFHFIFNFLDVYNYPDVRMLKNMVTPINSIKCKTKRFNQDNNVIELNIILTQDNSL